MLSPKFPGYIFPLFLSAVISPFTTGLPGHSAEKKCGWQALLVSGFSGNAEYDKRCLNYERGLTRVPR